MDALISWLRFFRKYREHLFSLAAEDHLGWMARTLPGPAGFAIRAALLKLTCKKSAGDALIYPGAYLIHTYGLSFGSFFSVSAGAHIDARGGITIGSGTIVDPNAVIVSSDHDLMHFDKMMTFLDHVMAPVVIEDDV